MSMEKLLTVAQAVRLSERLSRVPAVAQFDLPDEPQGSTLAHALVDWEESFRAALALMPKLIDASRGPEDLKDVLHEFGEELRHILYHIHDVRYFEYLIEVSAASPE
jgi:hypothetical protein